MNRPAIALLALTLTAASLFADEGKWTPQQVLQLDAAALKKQGLEIPPSRLWDAKRGTGLLAATVNINGCSAGFISPDGLFVTNHHCLFAMLQEHATPDHDYITDGYVAKTRKDELPGKVMRAQIARSFTDVTKQIEAAVPQGASDVERTRAIEKKRTELVAECEKRPATRCSVASFDGGVQYTLIDYLELQDIRLVYAPPRAVGEYGGEIDNWMWPRHTGDFAIGRAYVAPDGSSATFNAANVPFKSEFHFPISTKGVKPNDFVMVLGYPGLTYRSLTAAEMTERRDFYFARRRDVYREWIRILETVPKGNSAGEIAVADDLKSLWNRQKNAEGQISGFARGELLEKQKAADEVVLKWAAAQKDHRAAVEAYNGLAAMAAGQIAAFDRDFLLSHVQATATSTSPMGPKGAIFGSTIARSAIERAKPEAERDSLYSARNITRHRDRVERAQKSWYEPADKAIFADWVTRALALPAGQRIAAIDRLFAGAATPDAIRSRIDELHRTTKIFDLTERMKMFGESVDELKARHDPFVDLGFDIDADVRASLERKEASDGTIARLRPVWRRAVIAHAGKPVAPDANSTLRVTFGHVKGYEPRDGIFMKPQTTLTGMLQKQTGAEPFEVPAIVLAAAKKKLYGAWIDKGLGDVPVNFLADADTTGGNSGSPVVNGRGELVGVNFDRVWENVANDFGFNPDIARNVSVDIRYMLWMLDQVQNADGLLKELGVRK
jgi:hypothetical protein